MTNTFTKTQIRNMAKQGHIAVEFTKTDGTIRKMTCTLQEEFLPPKHQAETLIPPAAGHEDLLAAWDLEKSAWRSFKISSVISVTPIETPPSELSSAF